MEAVIKVAVAAVTLTGTGGPLALGGMTVGGTGMSMKVIAGGDIPPAQGMVVAQAVVGETGVHHLQKE